MKDKNNFFIKRIIAFLSCTKIYFIHEDIFSFKIPKNLITSAFFFFFFLPRQILKNTDMVRQKPQMLHWWNVMIESLKMIIWLIVRFFSVSDLNMAKQAMLFDSPRHGFWFFSWRMQIKSLYSPQSLLVHELKFSVKKTQLFAVTKFCIYPTPGYTGKMVFTNASKIIRS